MKDKMREQNGSLSEKQSTFGRPVVQRAHIQKTKKKHLLIVNSPFPFFLPFHSPLICVKLNRLMKNMHVLFGRILICGMCTLHVVKWQYIECTKVLKKAVTFEEVHSIQMTTIRKCIRGWSDFVQVLNEMIRSFFLIFPWHGWHSILCFLYDFRSMIILRRQWEK